MEGEEPTSTSCNWVGVRATVVMGAMLTLNSNLTGSLSSSTMVIMSPFCSMRPGVMVGPMPMSLPFTHVPLVDWRSRTKTNGWSLWSTLTL